MKEMEKIKLADLKRAAKAVNDAGVAASEIDLSLGKEELVEAFADAVESVTDQTTIPAIAVSLFNAIFGDAEPETIEEKPEPAKGKGKKKGTKTAEKTEEKPEPVKGKGKKKAVEPVVKQPKRAAKKPGEVKEVKPRRKRSDSKRAKVIEILNRNSKGLTLKALEEKMPDEMKSSLSQTLWNMGKAGSVKKDGDKFFSVE